MIFVVVSFFIVFSVVNVILKRSVWTLVHAFHVLSFRKCFAMTAGTNMFAESQM